MTISTRCPRPDCLEAFEFDPAATPYTLTAEADDGPPRSRRTYTPACPACGTAAPYTTT